MAKTAFAAVGPQIPELWSGMLYAEAENQTFWNRFEGPEGSGMPIVRKDDLTREAGDTIYTDLVLALTGAGITGDATALSGNEEALKFRQLGFTVEMLSHGVRWTEKVDELITHNMRQTALNQLAKWLAGKYDTGIWAELTGSGTTIPAVNQYYPGTATTVNTLENTDAAGGLTLNEISNARAYAESVLKIEPFKVEGGEEFYALVLDPYASLRLKLTDAYQQAQRDANVRGQSNPLFTGAEAVWDGVILYRSNRVPTATNDNTVDIRVARNVLFGANALSRGFAMYPDWREEAFDYGRESGVATVSIYGQKVNVYDFSAAGDNSGDRAVGHLIVHSAAVAPVVP